jgi:hypothetical protein
MTIVEFCSGLGDPICNRSDDKQTAGSFEAKWPAYATIQAAMMMRPPPFCFTGTSVVAKLLRGSRAPKSLETVVASQRRIPDLSVVLLEHAEFTGTFSRSKHVFRAE